MAPSPTNFSRVISGFRLPPTSRWIANTGSTRQLPTLYTRAKSFDILDLKVVNTSLDSAVRPPARELICQTGYLEDRLHRLESLAAAVRGASAPEDYRRWLSEELGDGLFRYYEVVPRTGPEYWDLLHATVLRLSEGEELDWDLIRIHNRLILSAVIADKREDVVRICNHRSDYASSFPTLVTESGLLAQPLYLEELSTYDPGLLSCRDIDLRLVSKMTSFDWQDDGQLVIGGHAYISSVDPINGNLSIQASLVNASSGEAVPLAVAAPHGQVHRLGVQRQLDVLRRRGFQRHH